MKRYISPSMKVRALQSEQLLAALSLRPGDGTVGNDDPIFAPHKEDGVELKAPRSVWADDEEE